MGEVESYDQNKADFMSKLEKMRPDLAWPEAWNNEQKAEAAELVSPSRMRTAMFASIPLICNAEKCTFASICGLLAQGLAPKGKSCPYESQAVVQFMTEYMEELGVDPDNLIEVSMIRDLVDQEIQYQRKVWLLSKEHFIQDNVVGFEKDGTPIIQKQLHIGAEFEDRLHKRKNDLRKQLLATRESRAKAGQGQLDSAQVISKILDDVRQTERAKERRLAERLGYADRDDYIEDSIAEAELVEDTGDE